MGRKERGKAKPETVQLRTPKGTRLSVSTDLAERLVARGYTRVEAPKPAPAPRKRASTTADE